MTKAKTIAPQAPKAQKTAADIMAMDDRPTFTVEVPEWGLTGEDAAVVRQCDTFTISKIAEACEDTAYGRCKRAALLIVEGCISPKFGPEHIEALITSKSSVAIGKLAAAIMVGGKKKEASEI